MQYKISTNNHSAKAPVNTVIKDTSEWKLTSADISAVQSSEA